MRGLHLLLILCGALLLGSCKRDLLEFSEVRQLTSNTTVRLNNIRFLDDSICIIGGGSTFYQSVMLRSADGGYTWSADSSTEAPKEMYGMGMSPNGTLYLSGIDGCILRSSDKGRSWQFNRIFNWLVYRGGSFATPDTGIFISTVLQRQCTITRVDSNFKIIDEQTFLHGLNNMYMVDDHTGYVVGYGAVMKTTDRGNTWTYLPVDGDNFTAMDIHGNEIWMCGANGSIFHTTDAGKNWGRQRNGNDISVPRYMLRSILFTTPMHGWAVGDKGVVIYTRDGGNNWSEYKRFTTRTLRGIAAAPNGDLIVAGDEGTIYRITPQ